MRPKTSGGFLNFMWTLTGGRQNLNSCFLVCKDCLLVLNGWFTHRITFTHSCVILNCFDLIDSSEISRTFEELWWIVLKNCSFSYKCSECSSLKMDTKVPKLLLLKAYCVFHRKGIQNFYIILINHDSFFDRTNIYSLYIYVTLCENPAKVIFFRFAIFYIL